MGLGPQNEVSIRLVVIILPPPTPPPMDRTVEAEVPDAVLERGPRPDKKVEMYLAQLLSHSKKLSPLLLMKNF